MTLEESIRHYAETTPEKTAVVCGKDSITYSGLWNAILSRIEELRDSGLEPARPYVYRASQDINFIVTYCAVHQMGAIAVPLEAQAPQERFDMVKTEVDSCTFAPGIADILYTTGTTGRAKGVMLSSAALEACADNFIDSMPFTSDLLFIISGPLSHIASLFKMHPTLTAGGTVCVLDGLKDMNAFFDAFNLPFGKFATFLVPASIRLIMQFSYEKLCALSDRIAFIETGAAPITHADMEQLAKALPHSHLYNSLGGTEIGCVTTYDFNDGKYMEGCIGRPLKHSNVEVTPEGNVVISGETIMSGYVANEELTRKTLRDGKIYGADLGYVGEDGMIFLRGRQDDVINVGGYKVDPVEVENVASSFPGVKDCICIAAVHPVIGTVLKLLVVLSDGVELDKKALALHIRESLESYKVPTYYEAVGKINRTYNGKLDRKSYR